MEELETIIYISSNLFWIHIFRSPDCGLFLDFVSQSYYLLLLIHLVKLVQSADQILQLS